MYTGTIHTDCQHCYCKTDTAGNYYCCRCGKWDGVNWTNLTKWKEAK